MSASREVLDTPHAIVSDGKCQMGTFNSAFRDVNLLQLNKPLGKDLPKPLNSLRLKEWQAIQISNEDWFICLAVYNTKSVGTAIIMAYNKSEQKMYRYEHKVPFWKLKVPSGLHDTHCSYHHKKLSIHFHNDLDNNLIGIKFQANGFKNCPDLSGHVLAHAVTDPIVIVQPFDDNRPLYSHKALMPASGYLSCDDVITPLSQDSSCVIIDDHKGYYPVEMRYDWVTALGFAPDGSLQGFNLTDNQIQNPEQFNENCLWHQGKMHPLPPIKVKRPNGVDQTWVIRDDNGRVNLTFTPLADVPVKVGGLGIKLIDYHGPTGKFSGFILDSDGNTITFDDFIGMGERKLIRL